MKISCVFIAALSLATLLSLTRSRKWEDETILFNILEQTLLNDSVALYQLQDLFFPPDEVMITTASIQLAIEIGNITSCYKSRSYCTYNETCKCYQKAITYRWTSSDEISKHFQLLQSLFDESSCETYSNIDIITTGMIGLFLKQGGCTNNYFSYQEREKSVNLSMHIQEIEDSDDLYSSLPSLVSWVSCSY